MNHTYWEGELEIYNKESVLEESEEPLIHLWQSKPDNVVFIIKKGYKLVKHKGDKNNEDFYVIEK